jgi:hypothetical protein
MPSKSKPAVLMVKDKTLWRVPLISANSRSANPYPSRAPTTKNVKGITIENCAFNILRAPPK